MRGINVRGRALNECLRIALQDVENFGQGLEFPRQFRIMRAVDGICELKKAAHGFRRIEVIVHRRLKAHGGLCVPVNVNIGGRYRDAIVVRKKLGRVSVYCFTDTAIDTFGPTGSQKGTDIPLKDLTAVFDINTCQKLAGDNRYVCVIAKAFANIAFYAWNAGVVKIRKIVGNIDDNRLGTV